MLAFVLKGRGELGYVEKPRPRLSDAHGVLLRPRLVSPCTSDVHTVWQGSPKRPDLTLGHECVAEVLEAGQEVRDFHPGEIVAVPAITPDWSQPDAEANPGHAGQNFSGHMLGKSIDGAFQEVFYLPYADKNLAHIPEGMELEDALMCVDVVQTGFTAAEEAGVSKGQEVAVLGIGAIGLAAIMACKVYGASRVFAVGSRPENVRIAEVLGDGQTRVEVVNYRTCQACLPEGLHPLANSTGSPVVNRILSETARKGVDSVLVCGGDALSVAQAVDMVKYGTGIVSNIMYFPAEPELEAAQQAHLPASLDFPPLQDTAVSAERGRDMPASIPIRPVLDAIPLPKFSLGRGMAGKTLKFSLSKGGRGNLERVMGLVQRCGLRPSIFITKRYRGLESAERALYDMKERRAVKVCVQI